MKFQAAAGLLAVLMIFSAADCAEPAHVHSHEKTVVAPTCLSGGYATFVCACGDRYSGEETPALGHSYEDTVVAPTYTAQGYTRHVCKVCGEEYTDAFSQMPTDVMFSGAKKDYLLPIHVYSRERKYKPEFVMIHFSSAVVLNRKDPYNMELIRSTFVTNEVSTHYILDRSGNISCYIPEDLVAFHAGKGTWGDDPKYTDLMNDYAIGIELAAIGSQKDMSQFLTKSQYNKLDPGLIGYTDAQYAALKALIADICSRYDIPMDRQHIIGHQEYAATRKPDPGELFDWDRLFS